MPEAGRRCVALSLATAISGSRSSPRALGWGFLLSINIMEIRIHQDCMTLFTSWFRFEGKSSPARAYGYLKKSVHSLCDFMDCSIKFRDCVIL